MQKLIIVRHGMYGRDDHLHRIGQEQMRTLAAKLKPLVEGRGVLILTSPADRARESAEILSTELHATFEPHEVLWSDEDHRENFHAALQFIQSRQEEADVLILVTHFEYVERFPAHYAEQELGVSVPVKSLETGEACVINCAEKTHAYVKQG